MYIEKFLGPLYSLESPLCEFVLLD